MHQDPQQLETTTLPSPRAGDFMRIGDALRLALEIADAAIEVAERRGGSSREVNALRMQAARLRAVL